MRCSDLVTPGLTAGISGAANEIGLCIQHVHYCQGCSLWPRDQVFKRTPDSVAMSLV